MKRFSYFIFAACLAFMTLFIKIDFANAQNSANDADGFCPLPKSYHVMMDGVAATTNSPVNCIGEMGKVTYEKRISGPMPSTINARFLVNEDAKHDFGFVAVSSVKVQKYPGEINKNEPDQTTAMDEDSILRWMPKMSIHHPLDDDRSPCNMQMNKYPGCYIFQGFKNNDDNSLPESERDKVENFNLDGFLWDEEIQWENGQAWAPNRKFNGWRVNEVAFAYHMDSPVMYGKYGNMCYGINESNGATGLMPFQFTYFVPSVPLHYAVSSAMSIKWDWPYKYSHLWKIRHWMYGGSSCQKCGIDIGAAMNSTPPEYGNLEFVLYHTKPKDPKTVGWSPAKFYSPGSEIQEPKVADERKGSKIFLDIKGVPNKLYGDKVDFSMPNEPLVVAYSSIRVKDTSNVAHVQIGMEGENTNLLKGECGKKISETQGNNNVTIRIVDNAPHAHILPVIKLGEVEDTQGGWSDKTFKVIFWHEMPSYQYVSFQNGTYTDPAGVVQPLIEMGYSPMFVWRKKTWNSLSQFLSDADGSVENNSFTYEGDGTRDDKLVIDPAFIVYEKKIPIACLFADDKFGKEDILPLHYAKTSLGDMFGNPPYSKDRANDMSSLNYADSEGSNVNDLFENKPIIFNKGKGPLKYFIEVRDGSGNSCGRKSEEKNFDCNEKYFSERNYLQGQLKYNPEVSKYVSYSSEASSLNAGDKVDPCAPGTYCLSEDYATSNSAIEGYIKDPIQIAWKSHPDLKKCLNLKDVGTPDEILDKFQAWGRVEIEDKIKPNLGLKIINSVNQQERIVWKINDLSTMPFYNELISQSKKTHLTLNEYHGDILVAQTKKPRPPFSDTEALWEFKEASELIKNSPDGKIYKGRDYITVSGKDGDEKNDSFDPYGCGEDIELSITHQDLRNETKKSNFVAFYAHDNIDGQRVTANGTEVRTEDWYKGVTSTKDPEFPDNMINKGYTSLEIVDETFPDYTKNSVFNMTYKNGSYCKYPQISFKNPNCKWDAQPFEGGKVPEISLSYAVKDRNNNSRKLKLYFYVAPVELNVQTIEKKEKRTE